MSLFPMYVSCIMEAWKSTRITFKKMELYVFSMLHNETKALFVVDIHALSVSQTEPMAWLVQIAMGHTNEQQVGAMFELLRCFRR